MRTYPSQYEAEAICEAMAALDTIYFGGCNGCATAQIVTKAREEIRQEYVRVFDNPTQSPWTIVPGGKKRPRKVVWDGDSAKAKELAKEQI